METYVRHSVLTDVSVIQHRSNFSKYLSYLLQLPQSADSYNLLLIFYVDAAVY